VYHPKKGPRNPEREADIKKLREEGKSLDEIGAKYGITRERVRQICKRLGLESGYMKSKYTPVRKYIPVKKPFAGKERLPLPNHLIPKDYIGEKFGVLLVFIKGEDEAEINHKVGLIKNYCGTVKALYQ
jgi:hypothetical protein